MARSRLPDDPAGGRGVRPAWAIAGVALWIATVGNLPLWRELSSLGALAGTRGMLFGLSLAGMIALVIGALASLFAGRRALKPALAVLLLSAAFGAHFMLAYRVVIDPTMMTNVVQTDPREVRDLLGTAMLLTVGGIAGLPIALLWKLPIRDARRPLRRLVGNGAASLGCLLATVLLLVVSFQAMSSTMRNHKHVRYLINPLNSYYALADIAATPLKRGRGPLQPLGTDAAPAAAPAGAKPPLVLLVVGETARAANFSLNGYARPTNPKLAALPVASFRNAWSCGTSTAASLPCMFSHLDREAYEARAADHENLLDVLQRAGLAVLWIDNQAGCKGLCDRVASVATTALKDPALCPDGECFDPIMLKDLDARIAALPAERRARGVVLVMHQMGSHGPAYFKRTPPAGKAFQPECTSNALQECAREQVVNAYDNTILATDALLAEAIGWLQRQEAAYDAALLYVSDHGESLGENNLYLHGLPYSIAPDVQKHVPWIAWLGEGTQRHRGPTLACLRGRLDERIGHEHLFHTVLGLAGVATSVYDPKRDAYAPCRGS